MSMEICARVDEGAAEAGRDFPTHITCDIGVIVLELEFQSWSAADGYAIYRDTNSHHEDVKVFNNGGKLVADIREDGV
jgi:hypothetical protein